MKGISRTINFFLKNSLKIPMDQLSLYVYLLSQICILQILMCSFLNFVDIWYSFINKKSFLFGFVCLLTDLLFNFISYMLIFFSVLKLILVAITSTFRVIILNLRKRLLSRNRLFLFVHFDGICCGFRFHNEYLFINRKRKFTELLSKLKANNISTVLSSKKMMFPFSLSFIPIILFRYS